MDQIQRVLIKLGRKDLAQEYYKKVAVPVVDDESGDVAVFTDDGKIKFTLVDRMPIDGEYRLVVTTAKPGMRFKPTTINTRRLDWRDLLEKSLVAAVETFQRTLRNESKLIPIKANKENNRRIASTIKLTDKLRTLILRGVKEVGISDAFTRIEEDLAFNEAKDVFKFLEWVETNNKHFGHGNIDEIWMEWKNSIGG